jgi:hypothetical protein
MVGIRAGTGSLHRGQRSPVESWLQVGAERWASIPKPLGSPRTAPALMIRQCAHETSLWCALVASVRFLFLPLRRWHTGPGFPPSASCSLDPGPSPPPGPPLPRRPPSACAPSGSIASSLARPSPRALRFHDARPPPLAPRGGLA